MTELNIESIGADWCIDDIIKVGLDENGGLFIAGMIHIPQNKLPHLKGTLTINNTAVNLLEAYSLDRIIKRPSSRENSSGSETSGSETYCLCEFVGNEELPTIVIALNSSFRPMQAIINNNPSSGGTVNR